MREDDLPEDQEVQTLKRALEALDEIRTHIDEGQQHRHIHDSSCATLEREQRSLLEFNDDIAPIRARMRSPFRRRLYNVQCMLKREISSTAQEDWQTVETARMTKRISDIRINRLIHDIDTHSTAVQLALNNIESLLLYLYKYIFANHPKLEQVANKALVSFEHHRNFSTAEHRSSQIREAIEQVFSPVHTS